MAKKNFVGAKGARLLRRVAKHILAEPRRYNQNDIISRGQPGEPYIDDLHTFPKCGTVACIGGWINILTMKRLPSETDLHKRHLARVLGVPRKNLAHLVAGIDAWDGWPQELNNAYDAASTPRERAKVAAARIEHFIKTGE
jgi:hypothetical protein